jgi:hypothetical protein
MFITKKLKENNNGLNPFFLNEIIRIIKKKIILFKFQNLDNDQYVNVFTKKILMIFLI